MNDSDSISERYLSSDYLTDNPTWDMEDSVWKANQVISILYKNKIVPQSLCEIGCGAGKILASLREVYNDTALSGYDIAPHASKFWKQYENRKIDFILGDFFELNAKHYDVLMMLDVLEHVPNPLQFLVSAKFSGKYIVVHFPLDLSVLTVLREQPLLYVRRKVGHIHYYTKGLALELLQEAGFDVIEAHFTHAYMVSSHSTFKTWLSRLPRLFFRIFGEDFAARCLGGETLMVLAKPKSLC